MNGLAIEALTVGHVGLCHNPSTTIEITGEFSMLLRSSVLARRIAAH
jgi:hypothetical protein